MSKQRDTAHGNDCHSDQGRVLRRHGWPQHEQRLSREASHYDPRITSALVSRRLKHPDRGGAVRILNFGHERGKGRCLRAAVAHTDGDILSAVHRVADRRVIGTSFRRVSQSTYRAIVVCAEIAVDRSAENNAATRYRGRRSIPARDGACPEDLAGLQVDRPRYFRKFRPNRDVGAESSERPRRGCRGLRRGRQSYPCRIRRAARKRFSYPGCTRRESSSSRRPHADRPLSLRHRQARHRRSMFLFPRSPDRLAVTMFCRPRSIEKIHLPVSASSAS